jgi:hypothetical protein
MILLRFISSRSFVSKAIQVRTDGQVSHVEYLDTSTMITFGARLQGGVTHRPYNYIKPDWEELYTFEGIEASYKEALFFNGRKYDWKDIASLAVGWHPGGYDPEEAVCSCLAGYSNRLAWANGTAPALLNPNLPTWEMTPQILYGAVTKQVVVY